MLSHRIAVDLSVEVTKSNLYSWSCEWLLFVCISLAFLIDLTVATILILVTTMLITVRTMDAMSIITKSSQ